MKSSHLKYLVGLIILVLSGILGTKVVFAQSHPMDGLNTAELRQAILLAQKSNIISESALFAQVHIIEPPKTEIVDWLETGKSEKFERVARLIVRDKGATKILIANLASNDVSLVREVSEGLPLITQKEWDDAGQLVHQDLNIRNIFQQIGIEEPEQVACFANGPGLVHEFKDNIIDLGTRRLLRVACYTQSSPTHPFGMPLEGFHAIVDVDKMRIIKIEQTDLIPIPDQASLNKAQPPRLSQKLLQPVIQGAPRQPNFKITNRFEVEWFRWNFHVRLDQRTGPIISLVRFDDDTKKRLIAYQISLSEMFVPYQDPDANWRYRTFLDNSELGLGYLASPLRPGQDCPLASAYLSVNLGTTAGKVATQKNAICIFERNTGDPEFRHTGDISVAQTELVVRSIPTVGNYDYIIDTIFTASGRIKVRVGSTGIDAVKTVRSQHMSDPDAKNETKTGALVAPFTSAILHDHYFGFRIDLDIDGSANNFIFSKIELKEKADQGGRDYWHLNPQKISKEGPFIPKSQRGALLVENAQSKNALGQNRAYQLMLGSNMPSILSLNDEAQRRAAFSKAPLWLTHYEPLELYAAGDFPLQNTIIDGVPKYSADKHTIDNQDIVLWPVVGFHHITRPEDWPFLSTMWRGFDLMPYGFFDANPALSLVRPQRPQR